MSNLIKQINSSDGTKSLDIYRLQESFLIIFYKNGLKVASFEHHYPAEFINHISYNFEFFEGYFFNGKPLENMDITECEIFTSLIPHTVNTSDKSELVGIGFSDGEALSDNCDIKFSLETKKYFAQISNDFRWGKHDQFIWLMFMQNEKKSSSHIAIKYDSEKWDLLIKCKHPIELLRLFESFKEKLPHSTPVLVHCDTCLDLPRIMRCNDVCRGV